MQNLINYYYNFNLTDLRNVNGNYFFCYKNTNYCFHRVLNDNFEYQLNLINKIKGNPYIHTLVLNKENKILTFDGTSYYILFRINLKRNRIIVIDDVLAFNDFMSGYNFEELSTFNWIEMWSKKIDYIEYFISSKDNITNETKCIFNYFIGMGENAILYLKQTLLELGKKNASVNLSLSHKRIEYNCTLYDLYNPMNLIIDHSSRDVAEYLKSLFYNKKYTNIKIDEIIKKTNYSKAGYMLLISRILFPTFFFDLLDEYNNNDFSYDYIIKLYNYATEYERFINYVFFSIKKLKKISIPTISWLIDKIS